MRRHIPARSRALDAAAILSALVLAAGYVAGLSWLVMIGLGVLHADFAAGVPAPGYPPCLAVTVVVYVVIQLLTGGRR